MAGQRTNDDQLPGHADGTELGRALWPADSENPAHPCRDDQAAAVAASIVLRLPVGAEFHADEIHRKMLPIVFCEPMRLGAVIRRLHLDGEIQLTHVHRSSRPSNHRCYQSVWRRVSPDPQVSRPTSRLSSKLLGVSE